MMQPCLGGTARTAVVAVMNPSHFHIDETFNTLHFAQRAMAVVNQVRGGIITYSLAREDGDGMQ